ncbi:preprotein translocase subunit SecE [SAR86 cluster bacterium]|jgi:preprotein translocase subunit SecE|uniref:Protein translocase subunit SecE n=1 Tax=SAR86 cluster bacterium TaxID=2030880 RepID=A0A9Q8TZW4_9GAMM|nr:preprotein translocase subunit SecE [SAR86 cluster bacterium]
MKLIVDARTEVSKVVWPGRGETTQMTVVVLIMILILALVFWGLDSLLSFLSKFILS